MELKVRQLPFLLKLLADSDLRIRRTAVEELRDWGAELETALRDLSPAPSDHQFRLLQRYVMDPDPRFIPGQLVRHRRYGYRGVVLDLDLECKASEAWYEANASQPIRAQPWYHLLVHRSVQMTYAAQSNLEADPSTEEVAHPLVSTFFERFECGVYVRNETPAPRLRG